MFSNITVELTNSGAELPVSFYVFSFFTPYSPLWGLM